MESMRFTAAAAAGIRKAAGEGRLRLRSKALRITAAYAAFAMLWIYFSDRGLSLLVSDPALLVRWSVYKGIAFVLVTSILLLLLILKAYGAIETGYERLRTHKLEIERFNRLYSALSQINQAIVLSSTREILLQSVCEALVRHGGFALSWVGWCNAADGSLQARAAAGNGTVYIHAMLAEGAGTSPARRLLEQVLTSGEPVICNDLPQHTVAGQGRELAREHALHAWTLLPIREGERVVAILNVHASEADFFHDKELALLEEAAMDLSFALNNFVLAEERQQAEALAWRESQFSSAMIESTPGVLYFYDDKGRFLRWNRNFEIVSGYSHDEIADMHPLQFFCASDQQLLQQKISEVFINGEGAVEAAFLAKDGTTRPYFFTGKAVTYNGTQCLVGVGIDISERKLAEVALRELNDTLELRVADRTTELQAAVKRAEEADRLKSAFLATMSHELRTPLNSIIGFTGIILQELAGPLNPEQAKQLGMVRGSARHLLELINDVLDLSKIEAGQLEVKAVAFDLRESVEKVLALAVPQADAKGLKLITKIDPALPAMLSDRRRVEQILINLLNNAIKFTDRGEVRLAVQVLAHGKGGTAAAEAPRVRMAVSDTGIGIKDEDLQNLFRPFRQLDTGLSRQHEGTGLGLAICRRLAALLGGEISVDSQWQVGSEFAVILPAAIEGAA